MSNLKPAPLFITPSIVARVLQVEAVNRAKGVANVPVLPVKLVDQPKPARPRPTLVKGRQNDIQPNAPSTLTETVRQSEEAQPAARVDSRSGPAEGSVTHQASAAGETLLKPASVGQQQAAETVRGGVDHPATPVDPAKTIRQLVREVVAEESAAAPTPFVQRAAKAALPQAVAKAVEQVRRESAMPLPFEERRRRLDGATAFLKRRCILVQVVDRHALVRTYRVSGKREPMLAEGVIEFAAGLGFEVGDG